MRHTGHMVSSKTFIGLASEADCLFSSQNISGTTESRSELEHYSLMNSTQPETGVPTAGVLAVTFFFQLKINEMPSSIARDIISALFLLPVDLFIWVLPGHNKETCTAGTKWNKGMGDKEWF